MDTKAFCRWVIVVAACGLSVGPAWTARAEDDAAADSDAAVTAAEPKTADEFVDRAIELEKDRQYEEASADLDRALQLDPKNGRAYIFRGRIKTQTGDAHAALREFDKAEELGDNSARLHCERAWAFNRLKMFDKALASVNKALAIDPTYARGLNVRANIRVAMGDSKRAMEDYGRAIKADPKYRWAHNGRGILNQNLGNHQAALIDYSNAIAIDSEEPYFYNNRGLVYKSMGRQDEAMADFDRAIELDSKYALAYGNRGELKYDQNKLFPAIADFDICLKLNPKASRYYLARAYAKHAMRDRNGAYPDVTKFIEQVPTSPDGYALRGLILFQAHRHTDAIADFARTLEIDPRNHDALLYRAKSLRTMGEYKSALADYDRLMEICHEGCMGMFGRATLKMFMDDNEGALKDLDAFLRVNPKSGLGLIQRASLKIQMEDYDGGIHDLLTAQTTDLRNVRFNPGVPGYSMMHYWYATALHQRDHNAKQAIVHLNESIRAHERNFSPWMYRAAVKTDSLNDYEGAITDLDRAEKLKPTLALIPTHRGRHKGRLKDYKGAIADFDRAIDLAPRWGQPYLDRSIVKALIGDFGGSEADFAMAMQNVPGDDRSRFAQRRFDPSEVDKARETSDQDELVRADPDSPFEYLVRSREDAASKDNSSKLTSEGHVFRGRLHFHKSRYQLAAADFSAAIAMSPKDSFIHRVRAVALAHLDKREAALEGLERAIGIDGRDLHAIKDRGRWRCEYGDIAGALSDFNTVIERSVGIPTAVTYRASAYQLLGDFDKALADHNRSIQADRTDYWNRLRRACFLHDQGNLQLAKTEFEEVLVGSDRGSRAKAVTRLWLVHAALNDRAAGDKLLREFLAANHDYDEDHWLRHRIAHLAAGIDDETLLAHAKRLDEGMRAWNTCQAYYQIGAVHALNGNEAAAEEAYRNCLKTELRTDEAYLSAAYHLGHKEKVATTEQP